MAEDYPQGLMANVQNVSDVLEYIFVKTQLNHSQVEVGLTTLWVF